MISSSPKVEQIPTSLYIHTPWCAKKCPYCDFNSHASATILPEADYLKALLNDLDQDLQQHLQPRRTPQLHSIFIGGGTPSLLSGRFYSELLEQIEQRVAFTNNIEITLEANPGTTEAQKILDYRAAGINRLSIGVQSFHNHHLKKLGRIHSAEEAKQAIEQAIAANFNQINIDLMFGLEGQTEQEALNDLQQALAYTTTHLSWYQLTIEPNTVFYRQQPILPNLDEVANTQESGQALLAESHFQQYEISAYCKADQHCQHNLNYWQFGDYLGIGAGAHGKISHKNAEGDLEIIRTKKTRTPQHFIDCFQKPPLSQKGKIIEKIDQQEYLFEFLLNTLRLRNGFTLDLAKRHAHIGKEDIFNAIPSAFENQLLEVTNSHIRPTPFGWNHINSILELLV